MWAHARARVCVCLHARVPNFQSMCMYGQSLHYDFIYVGCCSTNTYYLCWTTYTYLISLLCTIFSSSSFPSPTPASLWSGATRGRYRATLPPPPPRISPRRPLSPPAAGQPAAAAAASKSAKPRPLPFLELGIREEPNRSSVPTKFRFLENGNRLVLFTNKNRASSVSISSVRYRY